MRHKGLTNANFFGFSKLFVFAYMNFDVWYELIFYRLFLALCEETIAGNVSLYKSLQGHSSLRIAVCNPGVKC